MVLIITTAPYSYIDCFEPMGAAISKMIEAHLSYHRIAPALAILILLDHMKECA
jgi:hypothetical protein